MSKLFDQFDDMPLWQEAANLMMEINKAVEGNSHSLATKTQEITACLPAQLAYAGTDPNADIMTEIAATLRLAILLEHHLKMIGIEKPAKSLNKFKDHLALLLEDDLDDEFDDE